MEWSSNMTKAEKETWVIELLEQGTSTKEIARRVHISFRDIGLIKKRMEKEAEREKRRLEGKADNHNSRLKSKRTQAIRMFSEGKTPMDVVIELDLAPEKVRTIHREYHEMKNRYDVLQAIDQIKASGRYSLPTFLKVHKTVEGSRSGRGANE